MLILALSQLFANNYVTSFQKDSKSTLTILPADIEKPIYFASFFEFLL